MQTEMHGSSTEHRGSRLAPLSIRLTAKTAASFYHLSHLISLYFLCVCGMKLLHLNCFNTFLLFFFLLFISPRNWTLDPEESELAAVGSRMLFPNCGVMPGSEEMPSSRGPAGVSDLGLGLQSLRLSGWDRPWSSQDTDSHTHPSQVQSSSPSSKY